jgi:hypothetical protein
LGDGLRRGAKRAADEATAQLPGSDAAFAEAVPEAWTPPSSSRGWSLATISALQRTAGNAAVVGLLGSGKRTPAPARERVLHRVLAFNPALLGSPGKKKTYGRIKQTVEDYQVEQRPRMRIRLLVALEDLINTWHDEHPSPRSGQDDDRAKTLGLLTMAITVEQPNVTDPYVAELKAGRFKYASSDASKEVTATHKLIAGQLGSPSLGLGQKAFDLIEKYDLTEAEVLAIKVYSVGDYQTINPTLVDSDEWLKKTLPRVGGQLLDPSGQQILEPEGPKPDDPVEKLKWKTQKKTFEAAKAKLLAQTSLAAVKAEAIRHLSPLRSGLAKLPAFSSSSGGQTYRGIRLDWKEFVRDYGPNAVISSKAFFSTSKTRKRAEGFARKRYEDGYVGVLLVVNVRNGRDIEDIAAHANEAEVLLLPRARLQVTDPHLAMWGQVKPGPPGIDYELEVTEI